MTTYESAGVSLAKAEGVLARIRTAVDSTRTEGSTGHIGGFAGLYALDGERVLAATTDSVGTKISLARRAGRLFDAGVDLGAHCLNDVMTTGAEPLFFLDYVAAAELEVDEIVALVEGLASVCREAGCALVGGRPPSCPASTASGSSTSSAPASASSGGRS